MNSFLKHEAANHVSITALWSFRRSLPLLLLACVALAMCGCGGGSSTSTQNGALSGNWQFSMNAPSDGSFSGDPSGPSVGSVLQGGFLEQNNGSVSGQAVFSIWVTSQGGSPTPCNPGTATITGTVASQAVNLTATVGSLDQNGNPTTQTFTLAGQLSSDNSSIQGGTYTSTAGYYYPQGSTTLTPCGSAQSNVQWSAISIPPITGALQGFFHSTSTNSSDLAGQVFPVTGSLIQGPNTGASSATVTGSLVFTGYPCLSSATIKGQITGSSVFLHVFNASTGSDAGEIGGWGNGGGVTYPVTYDNTSNGYVLHAETPSQVAYALATNSCPLPTGGTLSASQNGDAGNICLAFGAANPVTGTTACSEPITVTPASVSFPAQLLVSGLRSRQTVTVENIQPSGSSPLNLNISLAQNNGGQIYTTGGDFNGLPIFTEQDTCSGGLAPQQSCSITVSFSPQQSCPWLPYGSLPAGLPPAKCPGLFNPLVPPKSSLSAILNITIPGSSAPDSDSTYSIPIKGTGLSAVVPSTPELDFGAIDVGETSLSQQLAQKLTFTNQSANPVQILEALTGSSLTAFQQACNTDMNTAFILPRPQSETYSTNPVPGLLVAATNGGSGSKGIIGNIYPTNNVPSVQYFCDLDQKTGLSSFQISSDSCSGQTLPPNGTCAVTVTFAPQPDSYSSLGDSSLDGGLDYFLQLNTLQCDLNDDPPQPPPSTSNPCEIDSGRFPVELTANPPGPLRMSPAAALDFGTWLKGSISTPLSITLTNDGADNLTVTLTGKPVPPLGSDYSEQDNCAATLSSGASCLLDFTFTPTISGIDDLRLVLGYNTSGSSGSQYGLTQYINLRGMGQ